MSLELADGGVRFAIFIECMWPTDEQIESLWELDGVEQVSSSHAQNYKVLFCLDSVAELTDERYQKAKDDIRSLL